jgi:hypothetical protein
MATVTIPVVSNLFEKTRKISEATHPPTVGHLNTPVGRDGKKKSQNEKQDCLSSHMMLLLFFPYSPL